MELCVICKKNETARLMDQGWGEKKPVCTDCLVSGRWRELLPEPEQKSEESGSEEKKAAPAPDASEKPSELKAPDEGKGYGDYLCPQCKVTHRAGSKVHKRHLKLLK